MLKIKKIKPMFTSLITTMNKYEHDVNTKGLITKTQGGLKEYQTVLAVGSTVRNIEVGDKVMINPTRYAKYKHKEGSLKDGVVTDNPVIGYQFKTVKVNNEECLLLFDQDVFFAFEGEEIEEPKKETSNIILPDTNIIV